MLFGANPLDRNTAETKQLQPVMTFSAPIIALRDIDVTDGVGYSHIWTADRPTKIATLAVGYADGYPRTVADTAVFLEGHNAPIVGRVSMDMITVDVTDIDTVKIGDEVELWGKNISVTKVAMKAETLSYELLSGVSARVPLDYIEVV